MKNKNFLDWSSSRTGKEQVARIFLKPGVWRRRISIGGLEAVLRLLSWFLKAPAATGSVVRSILVFDPGGLGDMVLLAPFLRSLRAHLPAAHIAVAGRTGAYSLLLEQGLMDEWIQVRIPWGQTLPSLKKNNSVSLTWMNFFRDAFGLRKKRFDLAFASGWSGDIRGNVVIWLAGARQRVGYGYGGGAFLLTDVVQPDLARPHVADRNLQILEHIGFPILSSRKVFRETPEEEESAAELLSRHGITKDDLVVGIHPGAGSEIREWGDERFAEVAKRVVDQFGAKILWFSDPRKPRKVPAGVDVVPVALSLRQFISVISRCKLFICNDSGPMHVAAALTVPVVAVFGPQRPEWFGPRGEEHRVVIRNDIWSGHAGITVSGKSHTVCG